MNTLLPVTGVGRQAGRVSPPFSGDFPGAGSSRFLRVVTGAWGAPLLGLLIAWQAGAQPANDNFVNAQGLSGSSGSVAGSNVNATKEPTEPNHANNAGGHSIWYSWVAPSTGIATFDTRGSSFDTLLAAYTGAGVGALTLQAANDDIPGGGAGQSQIQFGVQQGLTYRVAVDGFGGASGSVVLTWNLAPPPANDNFAQAQGIAGASGAVAGANIGATKEPGEPDHAFNAGGRSIWYCWTAPISGPCLFNTLGSLNSSSAALDTLLGVYTGVSVGSLTLVASNDNISATVNRSQVIFTATAGTIYWIVIDGKNTGTGAANGTTVLTWSVGVPPNDNFGNAQVLAGDCGAMSGSTHFATKEAGEPDHAGNVGGASVWFSWTATAGGPVVFTTSGSSFDTLLGVYTGSSVNALSLVVADDDAGPGATSLASFSALAGTTYFIAVAGFNAASGPYALSWGAGVPGNNNFASAQTLPGLSGSLSACNFSATKEPGEPNHAGNAGGHSIWYRWTAPAAGGFEVSTMGSSFDTLLAIYTGSSVSALTLVASNDNTGGLLQSRVAFPVSAGTVYFIALDGSGGDQGQAQMAWSFTQTPTIEGFFPHEGGEGTLLTIIGGPFHGGSPDDMCCVLRAGNRFIDIEVLTASPTQLVARVGVIPPEFLGQPLQLMVGVGEGARVPLCPAEQGVLVDPANWIWRGDAVGAVVAPGVFFAVPPDPANPGPALMNFHSGAPMGGTLMVLLDKDWGVGSRYCISARIHAQGTGADTRIGPATFTGNGTRFDCARRICDLLVKAFASHPTRPLTVMCIVTTNGTAAKITLSLPSGVSIDQGNIDIIQKSPPPIIAGLWDFQNAGLWRKEIRKHEVSRWYRCYEWRTIDSLWFERRAEGLWITRQALDTFSCQSHCIYRFPDGRIWIIWRTFRQQDLVRFWVHYRFWWPGRVNPLLSVNDPVANRTMMSMDDLQIVLPMSPGDPNPSTPFNEGVMIVDENGQQHFQGQPGFEVMPDIAANPNGFQLAGTAQSTTQLPPAADRIQDLPMQPLPGMANLQPGVIIQWLVDKNGNILVDHNHDGWPDPLASPDVLGGQKHQGLIAAPTGVAGTVLPVDPGNNQLQLFCWELDPNGEVRGALPGQNVVGAPVDLNGDGLGDNPIGGPVPADPTVRQINVIGGGVQETLDPTAKPVDIAVVEEAAPTDAQLAAVNANLAAQLPGFVPLQRPFILCINRIWVRRLWTVDRRYVFDTWLHHWAWQHRNHIILQHRACRVWLTKVSVANFSYAQHCYPFGLPPTWRMASLTDVRFLRICYRIVYVGPNQIAVKIDQMHLTLPADPNNPNSPLMLLSTSGDENKLFQEVPPAVLAGLQPDPLPVGPDGVFVEPIDPVAGTLDIGPYGTGVFGNRPLEARGMLPLMLGGNDEDVLAPKNNQLQLYCWALNPNGTIAQETFAGGGQPITLAVTPTPALPSFVDENGNAMDNPTAFIATLTSADNVVRIALLPGGGAQLSWDGAGQLQGSNNVEGTYADVAGGSVSPVTLTTGQMKRFFRVRR